MRRSWLFFLSFLSELRTRKRLFIAIWTSLQKSPLRTTCLFRFLGHWSYLCPRRRWQPTRSGIPVFFVFSVCLIGKSAVALTSTTNQQYQQPTCPRVTTETYLHRSNTPIYVAIITVGLDRNGIKYVQFITLFGLPWGIASSTLWKSYHVFSDEASNKDASSPNDARNDVGWLADCSPQGETNVERVQKYKPSARLFSPERQNEKWSIDSQHLWVCTEELAEVAAPRLCSDCCQFSYV